MTREKQRAEKHPFNRSSKAHSNDLTEIGEQLNSARADFLKVDVETALTFAGMALDTNDQEKKTRNRKNARTAYDTILHFKNTVILTATQEACMKELMRRLKSKLVQLGEKF